MLPESLSYLHHALLFSCFTVLCYVFAKKIYNGMNKKPYIHPMLIASLSIILCVALSDISIQNYQQGTQLLTWMIAPASIALMVPLASNIKRIYASAPAIFITLFIGITITLITTLGIAMLLGVSKSSLLALSTKSVTTPIALAIGEKIGSLPALSSLIVIVTGVLGIITGPIIFKIFRITDKKAQGITLGLSAHIIGSAYAYDEANAPKNTEINHTETKEQNPSDNMKNQRNIKNQALNSEYVAFSIISMSLVALISAFILPSLILSWL